MFRELELVKLVSYYMGNKKMIVLKKQKNCCNKLLNKLLKYNGNVFQDLNVNVNYF